MQFSEEPLFLKSLFGGDWNKVVGHKACNFINKRLQHRCFPVNITKFVVTPVLKNSCVWLLLKIIIQKDFLEKATGHSNYYMTNMDGQKPRLA